MDAQDKIEKLKEVVDAIDRMTSESQDLVVAAVEKNSNDPAYELGLQQQAIIDALKDLNTLFGDYGRDVVTAALQVVEEISKK